MANYIVPMIAAAGFTGTVEVNVATPPTTGTKYTPDANGFVMADPLDVQYLIKAGFRLADFATNGKVATADNGTTQTLTAAMITGGAGGAAQVFHTSAGGTTPSLTLPTAAAAIAAMPGLPIGGSYILRVINTNSGTATIVTNTGWSLSGTLTLATNTWREFLVTRTAAGTLTAVSVGTGTTS